MLTHDRSWLLLAIWSSSKAKLSTVDCQEADRLEFYYSNCVSKLWTLSRSFRCCIYESHYIHLHFSSLGLDQSSTPRNNTDPVPNQVTVSNPVSQLPDPVPNQVTVSNPVSQLPDPVPNQVTVSNPVSQLPDPVPNQVTVSNPVSQLPDPVPNQVTVSNPVSQLPDPVPNQVTVSNPVSQLPDPVPNPPRPGGDGVCHQMMVCVVQLVHTYHHAALAIILAICAFLLYYWT